MRRQILAFAALLCAALSVAPAFGQAAREWTSPEGGFTLTIPYMWNTGEHDDPNVVLFLRSLGQGPAGPSQIVCIVERSSVPPEGDERMLPRALLNQLTAPVLEVYSEGEAPPVTPRTVETIDGVAVGAYEISGRSDRLYERRFVRLFLVPNDRTLERYVVMCVVRTVEPAQEGDFASMRGFLSTLHFSTSAPSQDSSR